MTAPSWFRPWILPAALLLALFAAAAVWNRDHRQLVDAQRSAEAARLQLAGQIVQQDESAQALKATVADLLGKNADLAAAYAAAKVAAPTAKPIYAATLRTAALEVRAAPRVAPAAPAALPDASAQHVPPPALPAVACVLAQGDTGSISVQQIALQTRDGNVVAVGTAAAFRETPLPRELLFGGPFTAQASDVSGLAPPSPPRWGAGAAAACLGGACGAGPALGLPPWHVFGLQAEGTAGLLAGSHGAGFFITGLARW